MKINEGKSKGIKASSVYKKKSKENENSNKVTNIQNRKCGKKLFQEEKGASNKIVVML